MIGSILKMNENFVHSCQDNKTLSFKLPSMFTGDVVTNSFVNKTVKVS